MTKGEKIAREFMAYLDLVAAGSIYYTTFPDSKYMDYDVFESDSSIDTFVNVEDTRAFDDGDGFKDNIIIIVTVACRKGNDTAGYLNQMIDDAIRAIYLNRYAIQKKFHLANNIMPTGQVAKNVERTDKARGVANIYFNVPVMENAGWYMDVKET